MYFNDKLKETISKDFDKLRNLNIVKERIEENSKMKNKSHLFKYASGFTCLILLAVVGVILFNNTNPKKILDNGKDVVYINSIKEEILNSLDADVKIVDMNDDFYNLYPFVNNIVVPNDLNKSDVKIIYTRGSVDKNEYNILHDYVLTYESYENDFRIKNITISFSENYEPLRDYFIENKTEKVSKINNVDLKIYQYKETYLTAFKYNNINFDIETNNISENELLDLLKSIIK